MGKFAALATKAWHSTITANVEHFSLSFWRRTSKYKIKSQLHTDNKKENECNMMHPTWKKTSKNVSKSEAPNFSFESFIQKFTVSLTQTCFYLQAKDTESVIWAGFTVEATTPTPKAVPRCTRLGTTSCMIWMDGICLNCGILDKSKEYTKKQENPWISWEYIHEKSKYEPISGWLQLITFPSFNHPKSPFSSCTKTHGTRGITDQSQTLRSILKLFINTEIAPPLPLQRYNAPHGVTQDSRMFQHFCTVVF